MIRVGLVMTVGLLGLSTLIHQSGSLALGSSPSGSERSLQGGEFAGQGGEFTGQGGEFTGQGGELTFWL
eukprot:4516498-Pyramimonas_sp.AAC.1